MTQTNPAPAQPDPEVMKLFDEAEIKPSFDVVKVELDELPGNDDLHGPDPSDALIESIKKLGVLIPIIVVKNPKRGAIKWLVRSGTRRVKASRAAGLTEVPAFVFTANAAGGAVTAIVTDSLRSPNIVAEYEQIKALFGQGYTTAQVERATGMPAATIAKRMKLAALPDTVMSGLATGKIAKSVGEAVASMPTVLIQQAADTFNATEALPMSAVTDLKRVNATQIMSNVPIAAFGIPDPTEPDEDDIWTLSKKVMGWMKSTKTGENYLANNATGIAWAKKVEQA